MIKTGEKMDLKSLRKAVDDADKCLAEVFNARMNLVKLIAEEKHKSGEQILNSERESKVFKSVLALADNEIKEYMKELYAVILKLSKAYQKEVTAQL